MVELELHNLLLTREETCSMSLVVGMVFVAGYAVVCALFVSRVS